mgnify:CR=1 FL=1
MTNPISLKALVLEDSATCYEHLSLTAAGIQDIPLMLINVKTVEEFDAALADQPDVAFVDLVLKDSDSTATIKKLYQWIAFAPLIIVSSHYLPELVDESGRLGISYLIKGQYGPETLAIAVRQARVAWQMRKDMAQSVHNGLKWNLTI